jgi:hypothetical protein
MAFHFWFHFFGRQQQLTLNSAAGSMRESRGRRYLANFADNKFLKMWRCKTKVTILTTNAHLKNMGVQRFSKCWSHFHESTFILKALNPRLIMVWRAAADGKGELIIFLFMQLLRSRWGNYCCCCCYQCSVIIKIRILFYSNSSLNSLKVRSRFRDTGREIRGIRGDPHRKLFCNSLVSLQFEFWKSDHFFRLNWRRLSTVLDIERILCLWITRLLITRMSIIKPYSAL